MPNLWAVAMVKDEADVIRETILHVAAQGVTGIIAADNGSTDGTRQMLDTCRLGLECELLIVDDQEPGYWQALKMTALADQAHALGAEWILPFDADELWSHVSGQPLADVLVAAEGHIVRAPLWNYYTTEVDRAANEETEPGSGRVAASPFERMRYRMRDPQPIGKVIVRWAPGVALHAGNHGVTHVGGWESTFTGVQVRHFPYRSEEQFIRKVVNGAAAYAATDLPWETGMHWREYGLHYARGGEDALREIYREWFHYSSPTAAGLVYDPARLAS